MSNDDLWLTVSTAVTEFLDQHLAVEAIRETYEPKQLPAVPAERLAHPNTPKTKEEK